jgi:hypothetical protein
MADIREFYKAFRAEAAKPSGAHRGGGHLASAPHREVAPAHGIQRKASLEDDAA